MTALAVRAPQVYRRLLAWLPGVAVTGLAFAFGLLSAGVPLVAMAAALGLLALVVCLAVPSAATVVVIAILYSNAAAVAVRDHALPPFIAIAFPLLLALPLADQLMLQRKPVVLTSALPYLFGYLLAEVLATIGARDTADATDSLIGFLISGFGLFFIMTNILRTYSSLRSAIWVVLVVAAGIGALTTFQAVTRTYHNDYAGFATIDLPGKDVAGEQLLASTQGTPRSSGPVGETNRYGQVMLVLLPVGAMLALGERRRQMRQLAVLLTGLILLGMITTFSRGAVLGLVAVLGVAVLFRYVRIVHLGLLALTVVLLLLAFPRLGERLTELQALAAIEQSDATTQVVGDSGNLRGRATSAVAALLVWADHPLFGVGRGQFQQYYAQYAGVVAETGINARVDFGESRQAHNLYTSVAAETGTVGFVFFIGVFVVLLLDLYRARQRWLTARPDMAHLATGFFLALVAYLVSGIALHLSYERYLWFLLALAAVAAHLALKGDPDHDFEIRAAQGRAIDGPRFATVSRVGSARSALARRAGATR
jgi:O-antigen ligase